MYSVNHHTSGQDKMHILFDMIICHRFHVIWLTFIETRGWNPCSVSWYVGQICSHIRSRGVWKENQCYLSNYHGCECIPWLPRRIYQQIPKERQAERGQESRTKTCKKRLEEKRYYSMIYIHFINILEV